MPSLLALDVSVAPEVFARWPGYRAGIVVPRAVHNGPSDDHSRALLLAASQRYRDAHGDGPVADHEHIAAWRSAYGQFGSKPSRYRCSAEALLRRALGDGLPAVNQIVDLYNAVSVEHVIPVGGEDLNRVRGGVGLRVAGGGERFDTRASGAPVTVGVDPGEVVWADDAGVTCRRWNWRQCTRTELTESTTDAYFVFDALPPYSDERLGAAMDQLAEGLRRRCPGSRIEATVLRANVPIGA